MYNIKHIYISKPIMFTLEKKFQHLGFSHNC